MFANCFWRRAFLNIQDPIFPFNISKNKYVIKTDIKVTPKAHIGKPKNFFVISHKYFKLSTLQYRVYELNLPLTSIVCKYTKINSVESVL